MAHQSYRVMLPKIKMALENTSECKDVSSSLPAFSKVRLPFATAELITINEGSILKQSYEQNLKGIYVYEFMLSENVFIDFRVNVPATIFVILLEGHIVAFDSQQNELCKIDSYTCSIVYTAHQSHLIELLQGEHRIILLPLKAEWMKDNTETFQQFSSIVENYYSSQKSFLITDSYRIGTQMTAALKELTSQKSQDFTKINLSIKSFREKIVKIYNEKLANREYLKAEKKHNERALEFNTFVEENYTSELVNDRKFILKKFKISQSSLLRLTRELFTLSLTKYIRKRRMELAKKLLKTTKKSISDIGAEAGYPDRNYFCQVYKKYWRVSPSQDRDSPED